MAKKDSSRKAADKNAKVLAAFKAGTLTFADMGTFVEAHLEYRGYYISGGRNRWAGPWRYDQFAAAADAFPYAQQGYPTGIRINQVR